MNQLPYPLEYMHKFNVHKRVERRLHLNDSGQLILCRLLLDILP